MAEKFVLYNRHGMNFHSECVHKKSNADSMARRILSDIAGMSDDDLDKLAKEIILESDTPMNKIVPVNVHKYNSVSDLDRPSFFMDFSLTLPVRDSGRVERALLTMTKEKDIYVSDIEEMLGLEISGEYDDRYGWPRYCLERIESIRKVPRCNNEVRLVFPPAILLIH